MSVTSTGAGAMESAAGAEAGIAVDGDAAADQRADELFGAGVAEETAEAEESQGTQDGRQESEAGTDTGAAGGQQLNPDDVAAELPQELRHLLSDTKIAPHLQRAFNQLADYSKLGTVRDARAFAAEFPGGVTEALEYKGRALDVADWDAQYESGDPRQQADLVQSWRQHAETQGRPELFRGIVGAALGELRKADPEGYEKLTGGTIEQKLGGDLVATDGRKWNLGAQIDAINEAIRQGDAESLPALTYFFTRELAALGLGRRQAQGQRTQQDDRFKEREQSLSQREQNVQRQQHSLFSHSVNSDVRGELGRSIAQRMAEQLKSTSFTPQGKKEISEAILPEIEKRLAADRAYQSRVLQMAREARFDVSRRTDLVKFIVNRAKALVAPVAKDVITRETGKFMAATKEANDRRSGARPRVDITGGQAGRAGGGRLKPEQIAKMSDADKDAYIDSLA